LNLTKRNILPVGQSRNLFFQIWNVSKLCNSSDFQEDHSSAVAAPAYNYSSSIRALRFPGSVFKSTFSWWIMFIAWVADHQWNWRNIATCNNFTPMTRFNVTKLRQINRRLNEVIF